ncbi:chaperonin 10-like protein [Aspergillus floccosus]
MSKPNHALYVNADGVFSARDDLRPNNILPNELLIETHYSGVNPADTKHSTHLGIRSTVIGYDFSGRVLSVPPYSEFKPGDIVAGYTPSGLHRPTRYGTHQDSLAVPDDMVFKVPPHLPEADAAALTVVVMTAADVMHNLFRFPLPTSPGSFPAPLLIWGASSSVGISAVQLARASGCTNILVTASPSRHDLLKSFGASHVFDYSSPSVVADILSAVEALDQGPITHAFDAVGSMGDPSSADMVARCADSSALLASVVLRADRRFQMPLATTNNPLSIHPPGAPQPITIPSRPTDHRNAWKALNWAVDNYGKAFKLPAVFTLEVTAGDALEEIHKVADAKRGFGKIVFQHPFK